MAATVTSLLSLMDSADTETGWSGNSGQQDLEVYVQGGATPASYTWQTNKNSIKTADFTHASGLDASSYTYPHLYFWMRDDVMPFTEDKTTGTVNNSGLMVEVTLSNNATKKWHVAGADTWRGEWKNFMIDLSNTSDLFSSSGTWNLSTNTIDNIEWQTDNSNSGTIRIIDNTWQDVLRVGEGLKATGTSFDFLDISAVDGSLANMYGQLQAQNGVLFAQGKIQIGDGATTTTFNSSGEQITFIDPTTAGLGGGAVGSVHASLYELKATGSGCDCIISGDVIAGSGNAAFKVDFSDGTLNKLEITGNTINNANTILLPGSGASYDISGNTFNECGIIDVNGTKFENNTINSTTETTYGAITMYASTDLASAKNINLNDFGNSYGVYVPAAVTEITLDNFQFDVPDGTGGIYGLYWAATSGELTINTTNGTNLGTAGCTSAGTATFNIAVAASFSLTGLQSNTEVRIYTNDLSTELYGIENGSGTVTYNYTAVNSNCIVQIFAVGYEVIRLTGINFDGTNASIPIQQKEDRWYKNPS